MFHVMLSSGESILKRTPEMLPALKQAGVVVPAAQAAALYAGMNAALSLSERSPPRPSS